MWLFFIRTRQSVCAVDKLLCESRAALWCSRKRREQLLVNTETILSLFNFGRDTSTKAMVLGYPKKSYHIISCVRGSSNVMLFLCYNPCCNFRPRYNGSALFYPLYAVCMRYMRPCLSRFYNVIAPNGQFISRQFLLSSGALVSHLCSI